MQPGRDAGPQKRALPHAALCVQQRQPRRPEIADDPLLLCLPTEEGAGILLDEVVQTDVRTAGRAHRSERAGATAATE